MTIRHLWLQKTSEATITSPAHTVAFLDPALDDYVIVKDYVHVDPDCIAQYLVKLGVCIIILLFFGASELAPVALL